MTKPRPASNSMRNKIRAEIRQRWKSLSRRQLGCRIGKRNRMHLWLLASDMPTIIMRVIARELAKGESVHIPGLGTFHARFGGTTNALQGNVPGHKPIAPRRVVTVRFAQGLVRAAPGDGSRWSLKFRPSPLLKKAIQPGAPPLRRTRRKTVTPAPPQAPRSASVPPPRPAVPLAEIIIR